MALVEENVVEGEITGTDQFVGPLSPALDYAYFNTPLFAFLNIHVKEGDGSWSGVVGLYKSYDGGVTLHHIRSFDVHENTYLFDYEYGVTYYLGIPSDGTFSSGPIPVRLSK